MHYSIIYAKPTETHDEIEYVSQDENGKLLGKDGRSRKRRHVRVYNCAHGCCPSPHQKAPGLHVLIGSQLAQKVLLVGLESISNRRPMPPKKSSNPLFEASPSSSSPGTAPATTPPSLRPMPSKMFNEDGGFVGNDGNVDKLAGDIGNNPSVGTPGTADSCGFVADGTTDPLR